MAVKVNIRANAAEVTLPPIVQPIENPRSFVNFLREIRKEAIPLTKNERKRLRREVSALITGFVSLLVVSRAYAAPADVEMSPDVAILFMWLIKAAVMLVAFLAIICMVSAGIMRMFNQEQYAQAWTQNIMKGLGQAVLSAPIVLTICYICHLLFAQSPLFVDPWPAIASFFTK